MSEAVSALNGMRAEGPVSVTEAGLQGMITLRGDLASPGLAAAVRAATGTGVPGQRRIETADDRACAWMSPDELLLLLPYDETGAALTAIGDAMAGAHHLAVAVSDARALFRVSGPGARAVIAKLCPVDMTRAAFAPGEIRRTRMAQVPAAIWMSGEDTVMVICFRSVARYAFDLLRDAARAGTVAGYV